jgi:hypothetical protein
MQQPIIMAHHQIAYAAQHTASQVAHHFNGKKVNSNQPSTTHILQQQPTTTPTTNPMAQNVHQNVNYQNAPPAALLANGQQLYYYPAYVTGQPHLPTHQPIQNFKFIKAPQQNQPPQMMSHNHQNIHLSRSSSPKNSSSSHSDNENSTGSLQDAYYPYGHPVAYHHQSYRHSPKYHKKNSVISSIGTSHGSTSPVNGKGSTNETSSSAASVSDRAGAASSTGTGTTSSKKQKPQKPVKKVIVINLPESLQTIESVTSTFHKYGEILLVRVIKKGKILPFDLKQFASKIHDLGTTPCAIVEWQESRKF